MSVLVSAICSATFHLFGHIETKITQVSWPERTSISDDLEACEIEVENDGECSKVEDFYVCWCGETSTRTHLDYEA